MKPALKIIFVIIVGFFLISQISAQRDRMLKPVVKTTLTANPPTYSGPCPKRITFNGTIKVNKAMTVQYQFVRSDAAKSGLFAIPFKGPGTRKVQTTWNVSKSLSGWVELRIISPVVKTRVARAGIKITCSAGRVTLPTTAAQIPDKIKPTRIGPAKISGPKIGITKGKDIPTPIPKVADLIIRSITVQPKPGKTYQPVVFSIVVKNISNVRNAHSPSCYLKIKFSVTYKSYPGKTTKEYLPDFYTLPEIGSRGICNIELTYKFPKTGVWKITAVADGKDTVKEIKENNNSKFDIFTIK